MFGAMNPGFLLSGQDSKVGKDAKAGKDKDEKAPKTASASKYDLGEIRMVMDERTLVIEELPVKTDFNLIEMDLGGGATCTKFNFGDRDMDIKFVNGKIIHVPSES